MAKRKDQVTDIVKAVQDAPTKAVRVLPSSEHLLQSSYSFAAKVLVQLEVKANSGQELTKEDIAMFRLVQQAIVDLRRDERETLKTGADDQLSEEEIVAILQAKGISIDTKTK